ncbi:hypothetical protein F0562_029778 [Nyssa sinensis]|uniref:UDENN domain-containing protein n=1 Tax=Nyssa sinensis TaxID=561372 RepID=A0A5J5AWW7_9ASTE|nr:hypothetical protein F0562_029778 [Nyssa sinensis]
MFSDGQPVRSNLSRHILTTHRCYCILSRLPFFELHFGVLNSIFTEERLERLTKGMCDLDLESPEGYGEEENLEEKSERISLEHRAHDVVNGTIEIPKLSMSGSTAGGLTGDGCHLEHQMLEGEFQLLKSNLNDDAVVPVDTEIEKPAAKRESVVPTQISEACDTYVDFVSNKQSVERQLPNAVLPLLRHQQYESSESSPSFQGSPSEDRNFRSDIDEAEIEEASFSGQEDSSDHSDILEWAKEKNHGSLQIICKYYQIKLPRKGTSLELAEAHSTLVAEEEATALSVWAVACICGSLRLENVLTLFAGALLEKQIVVVCSNLGILSASVLSIIPLIRPYQWQSLLVAVLPNDMLDFLDAPVPYIVGVKNKTTEVQSKLTNVILVDVNKNQVRSPTIPQLPQHKELFSSLSPYHAKLVGESYLGRKRPLYDCTDVQVEAAQGFLAVLRSYLDSLCFKLRSHTITNVQSNDDKVSLLLKESFIESFPSRDRPFMKHFVDTQMFSVHTDRVLSFFQKE